MKEKQFQQKLIKRLKEKFNGCLVLKNDAEYLQGIPDLLILYKGKWAMLECKKTASASHRPNQDYYVSMLDEMSYARFINPDNEDSIIEELSSFFMDE